MTTTPWMQPSSLFLTHRIVILSASLQLRDKVVVQDCIKDAEHQGRWYHLLFPCLTTMPLFCISQGEREEKQNKQQQKKHTCIVKQRYVGALCTWVKKMENGLWHLRQGWTVTLTDGRRINFQKENTVMSWGRRFLCVIVIAPPCSISPLWETLLVTSVTVSDSMSMFMHWKYSQENIIYQQHNTP